MPAVVSIFVANARTALKLALAQISGDRGNGVLLPDFACDVLLHPIVQMGWRPLFYSVTDELIPNWDALGAIAARSRARALIMVHYFGQPQDVQQFISFCSRHELVLIDNNAHGHGGFLDGRPLGSLGDIGISSPRKLLGALSGGVLHGANERSVQWARQMPPYSLYHPRAIAREFLNDMPQFRRSLRAWLDQGKDWNNERLYREPVQADRRIDTFSRRRIVFADWKAIATQRRENWNDWAVFARNKGLRPVFPQVHPESCPWVMPIYARDLPERNKWLTWGVENRVHLFPWPSLPEEVIREDGVALARWRRLVCFPLDLAPADVES